MNCTHTGIIQVEHVEVPHCLNNSKKKGKSFEARKEISSFFGVPQPPPIRKTLTISQLTRGVCFQCPAPAPQRKVRNDSEALRGNEQQCTLVGGPAFTNCPLTAT